MNYFTSLNTTHSKRGQLFFSTMSHHLYDLGLYRLVTKLFWRCPTDRLLENYVQNVSANHLEVGVGSGYFLERTLCSDYVQRLALMDLNRHCLSKSIKRLADLRPEAIHHDVREPVAIAQKFKSVGMNYVLHCIPGDIASNRSIFEHLHRVLQPGGVLFGATLMPNAPQASLAAKLFMRVLNAVGIFNNETHQRHELEEVLSSLFDKVELDWVGDACVFRVVR